MVAKVIKILIIMRPKCKKGTIFLTFFIIVYHPLVKLFPQLIKKIGMTVSFTFLN